MIIKDHYKEVRVRTLKISKTYRPRTSPHDPAESKIFSIDHCSSSPVRRLVCIGDIRGDLPTALFKSIKTTGVTKMSIFQITLKI